MVSTVEDEGGGGQSSKGSREKEEATTSGDGEGGVDSRARKGKCRLLSLVLDHGPSH